MKLSYFSLLSPDPIYIEGIGNIRCPSLRDISKITLELYNYYISLLLLTPQKYYENIEEMGYEKYFENYSKEDADIIMTIKKQYEGLHIEEQYSCNIFNILLYDPIVLSHVIKSLSFFILGTLTYDNENHVIKINIKSENGESVLVGIIHSGNYNSVIDIILQRINIQNNITDSKPVEKIKNKKKVQEMLEKFKKSPPPKATLKDVKSSIPNIISSLASHSVGLNIVNIWDLTVYQLYDQFNRSKIDDIYRIHARTISVYGNKDQKFDDTFWLTPIYND